jgi:GcrA cell cycle regulator
MNTPSWPKAHEELLVEMWNNKIPAGRIALKLLDVFHQVYSRNAVIGKAHRLGLPRREQGKIARAVTPALTTKNGNPAAERKRPFTPLKKKITIVAQTHVVDAQPCRPMPQFKTEAPTTPPCSFWELTSTRCKWPFGDGPFEFCGAKKIKGEPYCAHHCRKAYNTPANRIQAKAKIRTEAAE